MKNYFSRNDFDRGKFRVVLAGFVVANLVLLVVLGSCFIISLSNKARVQAYIDDLESQGFNTEYYPYYPYNQGSFSKVYSYENFTALCREFNVSWVGVYGGKPLSFVFFFPSDIRLLMSSQGQYMFGTSWER